MILYGAGDKTPGSELVQNLVAYNPELGLVENEMKFCTSNKPKNNKSGPTQNGILEVSQSMRQKLNDEGKLRCPW